MRFIFILTCFLYILLQICNFIQYKNYICETNYIIKNVVNHITINVKATNRGLGVSFTTIEKTSKCRVQPSTTESLHRIFRIILLSISRTLSRGGSRFTSTQKQGNKTDNRCSCCNKYRKMPPEKRSLLSRHGQIADLFKIALITKNYSYPRSL